MTRFDAMTALFLMLASLMAVLVALLYFASGRKLLNFVDYGSPDEVGRLNRYAAGRLLLPVFVNAGCAYIAAIRPELTVPLIFLTPVSILGAVIWINVGIRRIRP